jgi:cytochrome c-type biogenesis protein CcmH
VSAGLRGPRGLRRRSLGPLLAALAVAALGAAPLVQAVDPIEIEDPALQERYKLLTKELRCMQCQNQSIADSPVGLAGDLRRQVRELLVAGRTDDEIRDYMRERYGAFILFRPEFSSRTAWLWLAPGVLLAVGAFVAFRVVRAGAARVTDDVAPLEERGGPAEAGSAGGPGAPRA